MFHNATDCKGWARWGGRTGWHLTTVKAKVRQNLIALADYLTSWSQSFLTMRSFSIRRQYSHLWTEKKFCAVLSLDWCIGWHREFPYFIALWAPHFWPVRWRYVPDLSVLVGSRPKGERRWTGCISSDDPSNRYLSTWKGWVYIFKSSKVNHKLLDSLSHFSLLGPK